MKKVLIHWIEMRTLEVPDECPTENIAYLYEWMGDDMEGNVIKEDSRDHEIVMVERI